MAQNVLERTIELRCRNFADFHLCCILLPGFWKFESSLYIMIRRLLYVPDYVVSSLNSS